MRHLLIERARRKLRERHGGVLQPVDVDDVQIASRQMKLVWSSRFTRSAKKLGAHNEVC